MRTTRTLLLVASACFAPIAMHAQTYFYVNAISTSPGAPTDQDAITVQVSGDLSGTSSYVASATAVVNGFNVAITVVSQGGGIGIPMLVPHTEEVPLGQLPAGTYTIAVNGAGTDDGAPAGAHVFTVLGGGGCLK